MKTPALSVIDLGNDRYRVTIAAAHPTTHDITIPGGYLATLGLGGIPATDVIGESVRFLLEREPNTAILRAFSLPEIAHYFPEFPDEIASRLRA